MRVQIPSWEGAIFGGNGHPIVKYRDTVICAKTAEPIEMLFGLWAQMGSRSHARWGPEVLRNVTMATSFWLSLGYNFGRMIASDTLFDSRGRCSGQAIR